MNAGQQWAKEEIRAEAERLAEQERAHFCPENQPGAMDEPDTESGPKEQSALRAGVRFNSELVLKCLGMNQIGDAEIFKAIHRGVFLFDFAAGQWNQWQGQFWGPDRTEAAAAGVQAVTDVYRYQCDRTSWLINAEKAKPEPDKANLSRLMEQEKALRQRIQKLQSRQWINDVLILARGGPDGLGTPGDQWDKNHLLLSCPNGVLELETGLFRDGQPGDMILTHTEIDSKGADEPAPTFERFMLEIMDNDPVMVAFLQRALGYCLSGLSVERVLFIFYGANGQNGKGTLLETLYKILGAFSGGIPAETLLAASKGASGAGARPDLMLLRGKRLVWCSETNKARALDAAVTKWITGGDTITCRTVFKDFTSFEQTAKIILLTNHKPKVDGNDPAVWHRLLLIPFALTFVENPKLFHERKRDKSLMEKLLKESSGILSWLYHGFRQWQTQGINPPEKVLAATNDYRAENNSIVQFLTECCLVMAGVRCKPTELFEAYQQFCTDAGLEQDNQQGFFAEMKNRFSSERTHGGRWYTGISLKVDPGT